MLVCLFWGEIKIRISGTFNDVCVLIFVIVQQQFYLFTYLLMYCSFWVTPICWMCK